MAMIDQLAGNLVKKGRLTLVMPDGSRREIGPGGGGEVTVKVNDRKAAFDIARNPAARGSAKPIWTGGW